MMNLLQDMLKDHGPQSITLTIEPIGDGEVSRVRLVANDNDTNIDKIFLVDTSILAKLTQPFFDSLHDFYQQYETLTKHLDLSKVQN